MKQDEFNTRLYENKYNPGFSAKKPQNDTLVSYNNDDEHQDDFNQRLDIYDDHIYRNRTKNKKISYNEPKSLLNNIPDRNLELYKSRGRPNTNGIIETSNKARNDYERPSNTAFDNFVKTPPNRDFMLGRTSSFNNPLFTNTNNINKNFQQENFNNDYENESYEEEENEYQTFNNQNSINRNEKKGPIKLVSNMSPTDFYSF